MSCNTTEFAPTTAPRPILTPGQTTTFSTQPRAVLDDDGSDLVDSLIDDRCPRVAERVGVVGDVDPASEQD